MIGHKAKIEPNKKYGIMTTTGRYEVRGRNVHAEMKCQCGNVKFQRYSRIKSGKVKSCGCVNKMRTHGMSKTNLYAMWNSLRYRCDNPKDNRYHRYGGRGITYDNKWKTFKGFYEDMGPTYKEGLQIDRINNNGNYTKENCKWVTNIENQQHKSTTYEIYLPNGKLVSLAGFCKFHNIDYRKTHRKLYNKQTTIEEIQNINGGK
jgi:hypothetical protein